jgi:Flp pilus assembly protein TadB
MSDRSKLIQYLAISIVGTVLLTLVWWKRPSGSTYWDMAIVAGCIFINVYANSRGIRREKAFTER